MFRKNLIWILRRVIQAIIAIKDLIPFIVCNLYLDQLRQFFILKERVGQTRLRLHISCCLLNDGGFAYFHGGMQDNA